MPRPRSEIRITMSWGAVFPMDLKLDLPPASVIQGVASDLRNGCGNAGLILRVKPQQLCDLTGALANQNDIVFEAQLRRQNAQTHGKQEKLISFNKDNQPALLSH